MTLYQLQPLSQDTWHVRFYVFMYRVLSCLFRIFDKKKIPKTKEILVKNRTCKRKKMNAWFLCSRHYFSIFLVWLLTIFCIFHFYGFQYNYTPHYRKRYNGFSLLSPLTSPSICPSPLGDGHIGDVHGDGHIDGDVSGDGHIDGDVSGDGHIDGTSVR
jgi:hypothetical protein